MSEGQTPKQPSPGRLSRATQQRIETAPVEMPAIAMAVVKESPLQRLGPAPGRPIADRRQETLVLDHRPQTEPAEQWLGAWWQGLADRRPVVSWLDQQYRHAEPGQR